MVDLDQLICLDCRSHSQLSQCELNGHQIISIHRFIQENIVDIESILRECESGIKGYKQQGLEIDQNQEQINLPYFNAKKQIEVSFKEVLERLRNKENELKTYIDLQILENNQQWNIQKEEINRRVGALEGIREQQKMNLGYLGKELADPRNLEEYWAISQRLQKDKKKVREYDQCQVQSMGRRVNRQQNGNQQ